MMVNDQWRGGYSTRPSLDLGTVIEVAKVMEIEMTPATLARVRTLAAETLKMQQEN